MGSLLLFLQSAVIWTCEGMIFLSAMKLLSVDSDSISPWLAVSFANLSYLIPSSPGAIGPFELAVKTSLVSQRSGTSSSSLRPGASCLAAHLSHRSRWTHLPHPPH